MSNKAVNTDAHGRPLPLVAPFRGRRLRLRYAAGRRVWALTSGGVGV
jgi:hypothetical protein